LLSNIKQTDDYLVDILNSVNCDILRRTHSNEIGNYQDYDCFFHPNEEDT